MRSVILGDGWGCGAVLVVGVGAFLGSWLSPAPFRIACFNATGGTNGSVSGVPGLVLGCGVWLVGGFRAVSCVPPEFAPKMGCLKQVARLRSLWTQGAGMKISCTWPSADVNLHWLGRLWRFGLLVLLLCCCWVLGALLLVWGLELGQRCRCIAAMC